MLSDIFFCYINQDQNLTVFINKMVHSSVRDVHTFICSNKLLDKFLYTIKDYFYYTTEICMGLVAVDVEWL